MKPKLSKRSIQKIQDVCCYQTALNWIKFYFDDRLPVYVRGIASSRAQPINLPNFTEVGGDVIVRGIEAVVQNGTELLIDDNGVLVDRPMDRVNESLITRVSDFPGTYMMMVRQALLNLERYAYNNLTQDDQTLLVPTLLVYDPNQVTFLGGVNIALSHDLEARRNSLLKVYLIESVYCRRRQ